jgi:hypothetical protein
MQKKVSVGRYQNKAIRMAALGESDSSTSGGFPRPAGPLLNSE